MLMRVLLAVVIFAAILIPPAPAQAQLSDDDIDRAMRKLQKYLLGKQDANGGWQSLYQNPHAGPSGVSSMVVYALVGSGVPVQHPKIQSAIKFLQGVEPETVYEVGLRAHAWGQLPDVYLEEMKKDARLLENTAPVHKSGLRGHFACPLGVENALENTAPAHRNAQTEVSEVTFAHIRGQPAKMLKLKSLGSLLPISAASPPKSSKLVLWVHFCPYPRPAHKNH